MNDDKSRDETVKAKNFMGFVSDCGFRNVGLLAI